MAKGQKTRRRKQRGGQGRLPVFQKLSGNRGVNLNLPTSLPNAPNESMPALNTISDQSRPFSYEGTPNIPRLPPLPTPSPPVEQTPPSSLEFQIFFRKFQRLIYTANLSSQDIVHFVILLANFIQELYLNSDEVIRVLDIFEFLLTYQYSNMIGNKPRVRRYDVFEVLDGFVRGLKRSGQLMSVDLQKLF